MPDRKPSRLKDMTGVPQILQDDLEALNNAFAANQAAVAAAAGKQQAVSAAQAELSQAQAAQFTAHQTQVEALNKLTADLAAQYGDPPV